MTTAVHRVRAPRGVALSCKGWPQEAALRMLMNNLDPDVAERPEELIVYGGSGKAVRSWACFDAIVDTLRSLEHDETLLVQSGKPVGVFRTHPWAPRVLIANALLVPAWATWDTFRDLEDRGLTMFGQMTAGSWIYIGTQGILQGTYETLAAVGRQHFGGSLAGRLVVTAGLGGMGGAQPLAVTMNDGVTLVVEVDARRIERRLATRYVDETVDDLETAVTQVEQWRRDGTARSLALHGNAADVLPELLRRGLTPDVVTDQTSAHDALRGYVPNRMSLAQAEALRDRDPNTYVRESMRAMGEQVEAMLELKRRGAIVFDYGNNLRVQAVAAGVTDAFDIPGFVPEYIRPLFCEGKGPFRWAPSPAIRPIFGQLTGWRWRCFETMPRCASGSGWPANASPSRGCRRGSSGWATATGRASVWPSTTWCAGARSRRRSSSAATIWTQARSRHPIARPRGCGTAVTRLPTGRCSMRCSIRRPARPGSRSTTAAASASGIPCTPGWSWWPMAVARPTTGSNAS